MKSLPSSISPDQLVNLWGELLSAYYGHNHYGGDTAEIYAYTLQRRDPKCDHEALRRDAMKELAIDAARALYQTVRRFSEEWNCECTIDGMTTCDWWFSAGDGSFDHRAHVKVTSKG